MNIQVKINGVNVTSYTINYTRIKKICTGVGTLQLTLSKNYSTAIFPNDTVQIYENGSLVGTYIVNTESIDDPSYDRVIEAQDGSKRLTDYFIAEVTTITYPVQVSYYIKKYITDCGLSYVLDSLDTTGILPNNTVLGHMSAYEQIIQLLQLSNWYFYFDSTNVCHLGKLTKDISVIDASFDRTDIINIKTVKDDKILRNRAVVWGTGNPSNYTWVFADVKVQTKWNHDANDIRTAVFGSSNIPDLASAYTLATQMINAFARISYTKEARFWGARNLEVGNIVYLSSNVYNGSGLVTTYEVSMSKDGLTTTVILDEFCPRIFGWYDFGDYVYIGTNGSGVWRKHLKLDHTWTNYSTGLTDLNITDLYKNNGILSCVSSDGSLFRRSDIGYSWTKVPITNITTTSGITITSGLMARATTQDRMSNTIHALVDNRTDLNSMNYGINSSGILSNRDTDMCFVVEVDPNLGNIVASHQVNVSGFKGIVGFDIDNDGQYDYVSIGAVSSGGGPSVPVWNVDQYDFGINESQWYSDDGQVSFSGITDVSTVYNGTFGFTGNVTRPRSLFTSDSKDNRYAVEANSQKASREKLTYNPITSGYGMSTANVTCSGFTNCYGVYQIDKDEYRILGGEEVIIDGFSQTQSTFWDVKFDNLTYTKGLNTDYTILAPNDVARVGNRMYIIIDTSPDAYTFSFDIHYYDLSDGSYGLEASFPVLSGNSTDRFGLAGKCIGHYGDTFTYKFVVRRHTLWSTVPDYLAIETRYVYVYDGSNFILVMQDAGCYYPYPGVLLSTYIGAGYAWGYETYGRQTNTFVNGLTSLLFKGNLIADPPTYSWVTLHCFYPLTSWTSDGHDTEIFNNYPNINDTGPVNPNYVIGRTVADSTWKIMDALTGAALATIDQTNYTIRTNFVHTDVQGRYMFTATRLSDSYRGTLFVNLDGTIDRFISGLYDAWNGVSWPSVLFNSENWIYAATHDSTAEAAAYAANQFSYVENDYIYSTNSIHYIPNQYNVYCPPSAAGVIYLVAQRNNNDFQVVQSGTSYYRLDISNSFPLTIVPSGMMGMGFIETCSGFTHYMSTSTDNKFVNDFRYTFQNTGSGYKNNFFYSTSGNLNVLDISVLSNIDYNSSKVYYNTSSGNINAIETSNFQLPAQYMFAVINNPASGVIFLQQDAIAISGGFIPYCNNLPASPINIIRLDDRL